MKILLRKLTDLNEHNRPHLKNKEIFKLPEYIQLMSGNKRHFGLFSAEEQGATPLISLETDVQILNSIA